MRVQHRWILELAVPALIGFVLASVLVLGGFQFATTWIGEGFFLSPLPGYDLLSRDGPGAKPKYRAFKDIEQRYGSPLKRSEDGRECVWFTVLAGNGWAESREWLLGGPTLSYGDTCEARLVQCQFDENDILLKWEYERVPTVFFEGRTVRAVSFEERTVRANEEPSFLPEQIRAARTW